MVRMTTSAFDERPDLVNYIRISAGRPEDPDRLVAALREI